MASSMIVFSFTLCLCFVPVFLASDQCVPLKGGPFEACSIAGYNYTFPIPHDLSSRSKARVKRAVNYMTRMVKNCSVASIAETMACSYLAPYCKNSKAVLPCRRVCSEFLKRCESKIPPFLVDALVATCTLLVNSTSREGNCFEPPDFAKYHNTSRQGPLERKCEEIIFPFCKNLGYPLTALPRERQISVYKLIYGKNYTDTEDATTPEPNSALQKLFYYQGNHSSCSQDIKQMFCADYIPPCFKNEGLAYYTVCKDVCMNIGRKCPDFLGSNVGYFLYCERLAAGNTSDKNGYCKHTSWPPPMKWLDVFRERPTPPTKEKGGMGGVVIAVIVVVPLIIVGVTIGLVYYCKTRRLTSKGYSRQEDDKTDLVT